MNTVLKQLFLILIALYLVECKNDIKNDANFKSRNMDPVDSRSWNLPPGHIYDKIFEITDDNHDWKVLESNDAWIVVFYKSKISRRWRKLSEKIGGAVWFGAVDVEKNPILMENMKIDERNFNEKTGLAFAYPLHRNKKIEALEKDEVKSTTDSREAELFASAMIPDRSTDFTFKEEEFQKFNDWVVKGYYYEQPPKFPIICLTDDTETPIHVKVLSHYMYTHFNFAIVRKGNVENMRKMFKQVPLPEKYPSFLVLLGKEPSSEEMNTGSYQMRFNIVPYIDQKYGNAQHFKSLLNFLFIVNDDYRKELPGRLSEEPPAISNMDNIRARLSERVINVSRELDNKKKTQKSEL